MVGKFATVVQFAAIGAALFRAPGATYLTIATAVIWGALTGVVAARRCVPSLADERAGIARCSLLRRSVR
jgi:hypothetical protein